MALENKVEGKVKPDELPRNYQLTEDEATVFGNILPTALYFGNSKGAEYKACNDCRSCTGCSDGGCAVCDMCSNN
ncbi:MAG: hypothetical protein QME12_08965 [Nanoarchaeota archaeon]|nr:hypothetical protein [Nanoarchaeota archaeon]